MALFKLGDTVRLETKGGEVLGPKLLIIGEKKDLKLAIASQWLCLWPETGNSHFIPGNQITKAGQ